MLFLHPIQSRDLRERFLKNPFQTQSRVGDPVLFTFHPTPVDLIEQFAQALASRGVDGFEEGNSAFKVRLEMRMIFAILAGWAVTDAVDERGFQAVEVGAADVQRRIRDQTSQVLARRLAHDASLAVMDRKPFFEQNGGYVDGESRGAAIKISGLRGVEYIVE